MTAIKSVVADAKRIVIKVGTALLTDNGRGLDEKAIANLAEELSAVQKLGREVVLVSSGSIAEGVRRLGWERRPTEVGQLQAAAAVGQMGLAQAYETEFAKRGVKTAQILLTGADLADRTRYLNARSALLTLLSLGVVPVINENDTVVTDEIKVGDNDTLGSVVTNLIEADALVILTDQKGLFTADPRKNPDAVFVDRARAGDPALEKMAGGADHGAVDDVHLKPVGLFKRGQLRNELPVLRLRPFHDLLCRRGVIAEHDRQLSAERPCKQRPHSHGHTYVFHCTVSLHSPLFAISRSKTSPSARTSRCPADSVP